MTWANGGCQNDTRRFANKVASAVLVNDGGCLMELPERFEDLLAIERLNSAFCFELDRGTPEGFAALFVEDAYYTHGPRESRGRVEILAFARSRTATAPRTARHVPAGLRVTFQGATDASGISCCTTFAASALPPIASTIPVLVADFQDVYVKRDGNWLFAERLIIPIFTPAQ